MTKTVAGNGMAVPFGPGFPYGAGNCLFQNGKINKFEIVNINC